MLHPANETTDDAANTVAGASNANTASAAAVDETAAIKTEYAELSFTTESAIQSTVFNTRVVAVTSKEVDLVWERPAHSDSPVDFYEVRWFARAPDAGDLASSSSAAAAAAAAVATVSPSSANKTTLSTKEPRAHVDGLAENTEYGFQVRCKTLSGWGTYSQPVYAQTLQSVSPGE